MTDLDKDLDHLARVMSGETIASHGYFWGDEQDDGAKKSAKEFVEKHVRPMIAKRDEKIAALQKQAEEWAGKASASVSAEIAMGAEALSEKQRADELEEYVSRMDASFESMNLQEESAKNKRGKMSGVEVSFEELPEHIKIVWLKNRVDELIAKIESLQNQLDGRSPGEIFVGGAGS